MMMMIVIEDVWVIVMIARMQLGVATRQAYAPVEQIYYALEPKALPTLPFFILIIFLYSSLQKHTHNISNICYSLFLTALMDFD